MRTTAELDERLSDPPEALVAQFAGLSGDIMALGAGGKMGASLLRLAARAREAAGAKTRVIGVSRFSQDGLRDELTQAGVETIVADVADERQLAELPDIENIIYMVGAKFGTTGREHATWATNAYLPGRVAERFRDSRIVAFSTGNVYGLVPIAGGGASERRRPNPSGEYAQSCLGRERVLEHFSHRNGTPMVLLRLNYAIDLRYGVLIDVARAVWRREPVDVRMGVANVIWQGDANHVALRSLDLCATPPQVLNVTGPETVSIRWLARRFGELMDRTPELVGEESETALLNNAAQAHELYGYPRVTISEMIDWTAEWVRRGGPTLDKPTQFQEREGNF